MKDIHEAKAVQIAIDEFGKVWVNVDGVCAVRIGFAENVVLETAEGECFSGIFRVKDVKADK